MREYANLTARPSSTADTVRDWAGVALFIGPWPRRELRSANAPAPAAPAAATGRQPDFHGITLYGL